MEKHSTDGVRILAVTLLALMSSAALQGCNPVQAKINDLQNRDPHVRDAALTDLKKRGEPAIDSLVDSLKSQDTAARDAAADALGQMGEQAVQPLVGCLSELDAGVRSAAGAALVRIGEPAVKPLIDSLTSNDPNVRDSASAALAKIGAPAVAPLTTCLENQDSTVRAAAAKMLQDLGYRPQNTAEKITFLIASQSWDDLASMGRLAVEPLVACFKDQDSTVQSAAADALTKIGEPAVARLGECLKDPDAGVQALAAQALEGIGSSDAIAAVAAPMTDLLPRYSEELSGDDEVRITNPNDFFVVAGLRQGNSGTNMTIPRNASQAVFVPDGTYSVFFVYSNDRSSLLKGDDFTLQDNGVEIQIVEVESGNYNIQKVN